MICPAGSNCTASHGRCADPRGGGINEKGGLLGKQIQLIRGSRIEHATVRPDRSQDGIGDKSCRCAGGMTSVSAKSSDRRVCIRRKRSNFYNTQYEGGVCDRQHFLYRRDPAQNLASAFPEVNHEIWQEEFTSSRPTTITVKSSRMGQKICHRARRRGPSRPEFFPLDVSSSVRPSRDSGGETDSGLLRAGLRRTRLLLPSVGRWLAWNKKIPIASSTFSHGQEEVVLSAEEATES